MNNLISLDIMKEMWGVALSFVIALVVVKISLWLYRWANPNCSGKLPPGSMGFPVIGETVEFFKPYSFNEIHPFVKKRMFKLVFIKSAGFKNLSDFSSFFSNLSLVFASGTVVHYSGRISSALKRLFRQIRK
jgi:hypothetical protein